MQRSHADLPLFARAGTICPSACLYSWPPSGPRLRMNRRTVLSFALHVAVRFPTSSVRRPYAANRHHYADAPGARVRNLSRRRQQSRRDSGSDARASLRTSRTIRESSSPWKTRPRYTESVSHTDEYTIAGGSIGHVVRSEAHEMSDEGNLARFVARTLDNAEASGSPETWIDLSITAAATAADYKPATAAA